MVHYEDTEWEQLNRANWKGLGLTDPIKTVEVRRMKVYITKIFKFISGQMAFAASLP